MYTQRRIHFVQTYTITCTYTQSHKHTKTNLLRIDIHKHMYTQMRIYICTDIRDHMYIYTITYAHKGEFTWYRYTQSHVHISCTQSHIHTTCMHTHIHIKYIHTEYIPTYIQISRKDYIFSSFTLVSIVSLAELSAIFDALVSVVTFSTLPPLFGTLFSTASSACVVCVCVCVCVCVSGWFIIQHVHVLFSCIPLTECE